MFTIKNILRNKVSSLIIIVIMIISMISFNIIFNLFFNSAIESYESNIFSNNNNLLEVIYEKEQNATDIINLMSAINKDSAQISFGKAVTFKGELFDKVANVMCITNSDMYKYNLLKGRNINNQDVKMGNKVAVISKVYEGICRKEDDKLLIDIDNDSYEVVGIIGNKYSRTYYALDIFIPYTAVPQQWINSDKISSVQFQINTQKINIDSYMSHFNIKECSFSPSPTHHIFGFLFATSHDVIYFLTLSLTSIINMLIFSMYWINKKQNQIGILKALGYSNKDANILVRNELLILSLISSIISCIIYYPFSIFFNTHFFDIGLNGSPIIFVVDVVFSFVCSLIVVKFNSRRLNKLTISSNINTYTNLSKKLWIKIILIIQIFLVFRYSLEAFSMADFVFSTINKANTIVSIDDMKIVNPFSVSFDNKILKNYEVQKTLSNLKQEKDIVVVNYLYDSDSSIYVANMKNKNKKNYYDINYSLMYLNRIQSDNVIPLMYMEKDSFKGLKLNIDYKGFQLNDNETNIPVYAGYDYKSFFSIGDIIKGDSGNKYKIIGFLDKDQFMFSTNSSTDALSYTNNLNSFLVVPYDITNITKLPPHYDETSFEFYTMTNNLFLYKTEDAKLRIDSILKEKGIDTTYLSTQMKKFTMLNFSYVSYKLFNVIMILLMCLAGIIGFILSSILSEKREIGIKMALGFSKWRIITEYTLNIFILLSISFILFIVSYIMNSEFNLTLILLIKVLFVAISISIPALILIRYLINNFEPSELIGGER